MTININQPVVLSMDEREIDEHIPSINFHLSMKIQQSFQLVEYCSSVWISCSALDKFMNNMAKINQIPAILLDMNENPLISIKRIGEKTIFEVMRYKSGVNQESLNLSYQSGISEELFHSIKKEFTNYPKWW